MKRSDAARADRELAPILIGPRKCAPVPSPAVPALTPEEQSNLRAKDAFVDAVARAGLAEHSVRDLALWFGVKRSKLFERMSTRRKDLAPLPEWFEKLERHATWNALNAEFAKRSA